MTDDQKPLDDHTWLRSRLIAYHAGLLESEDIKRFELHLQSCAPCKTIADEYCGEQDQAETPNGHLPPDLLARWKDLSPKLSGLERELVASHLKECVSCQEDLRFLGHEPILSSVVILPDIKDSTKNSSANLDWKTWAGMSWGGLATAALLLVMFWPQTPSTPPLDNHTSIPWIMSQRLRGGETTPLTIDSGTRRIIAVVHVPVDWPTEEPAVVDVFLPGGNKLTTIPLGPNDLQNGTVMLSLDIGIQPETGSYRMVFRPANPASKSVASVETRFELESTGVVH